LDHLVEKVPGILQAFDSETGRFGTGIWTCRDQHPMYPLAVAYSTASERNRYYQDPKILEVIVKGGDPLLANMDESGQWIFAKKDGSTWGRIWMPWTYSRWIRTYQLVRDDLPAAPRKAWTDALTLGYTGISRRRLGHVHNIPTHHAMGLFAAGKVLDRPAWCEKAATFHHHFTYPGGQSVEPIDQRNPYHDTVAPEYQAPAGVEQLHGWRYEPADPVRSNWSDHDSIIAT
jgi:hypothetical protein